MFCSYIRYNLVKNRFKIKYLKMNCNFMKKQIKRVSAKSFLDFNSKLNIKYVYFSINYNSPIYNCISRSFYIFHEI
jgi:hypothetical protein